MLQRMSRRSARFMERSPFALSEIKNEELLDEAPHHSASA
jgi:hypothetical protein